MILFLSVCLPLLRIHQWLSASLSKCHNLYSGHHFLLFNSLYISQLDSLLFFPLMSGRFLFANSSALNTFCQITHMACSLILRSLLKNIPLLDFLFFLCNVFHYLTYYIFLFIVFPHARFHEEEICVLFFPAVSLTLKTVCGT